MHNGSPQWYKLESWVDIENVDKNGICIKSVRAFTKKKYAKDWLKSKNWKHLVIRSATIN